MLFGTMHVYLPQFQFIENQAMEMLNACDQLIAETDIDQLSSMDLVQAVPFDLYQFLSPAQIRRYRNSLFKQFGLQLDLMRHLHPIFFISSLMCAHIKSSSAIDYRLFQQAKFKNISTGGLESIEEQASMFRHLNIEFNVRQVKRSLRNLSKFKREVDQLIKFYLKQEIHTLAKMSKANLGVDRHLMLSERNVRMASRILDLMQKDRTTMVMFGAGHLSGQKGVLHLLVQAGAKVLPLNHNR